MNITVEIPCPHLGLLIPSPSAQHTHFLFFKRRPQTVAPSLFLHNPPPPPPPPTPQAADTMFWSVISAVSSSNRRTATASRQSHHTGRSGTPLNAPGQDSHGPAGPCGGRWGRRPGRCEGPCSSAPRGFLGACGPHAPPRSRPRWRHASGCPPLSGIRPLGPLGVEACLCPVACSHARLARMHASQAPAQASMPPATAPVPLSRGRHAQQHTQRRE